jgi:hypothetical protein
MKPRLTALGVTTPIVDVDGTHQTAYCKVAPDQWHTVHLRRATEADPRETWIGSPAGGWWVPDETLAPTVMPKGWEP